MPQEHREAIVNHIVYVHTSVLQYTIDFETKLRRRNYVTPRHFLDFINTYLKLLTEKKNFINLHCAHLSGGICLIFFTNYFYFIIFKQDISELIVKNKGIKK